MFKSILDDVKQNFSIGNMVTKLIIVNVVFYMIAALIVAFSKGGPTQIFLTENFFLPGEPMRLLFKPWTLITYMFMQIGFFHLLWNMVGLNLFGTILGDLLGDRRVLPIYLLGGIMGGIFYLVASQWIGGVGFTLHGASAAVLAIAAAAAIVAPDYEISLLLIGRIRLKYIVLAFIFFGILMSQGNDNTGGHFAHLGGLFFGLLFGYFLQRGQDISLPVQKVLGAISNISKPTPVSSYRPTMRVEHRSEKLSKPIKPLEPANERDYQEQLDYILDKIKQKGYDKLSKEEKDFLQNASKN